MDQNYFKVSEKPFEELSFEEAEQLEKDIAKFQIFEDGH
jgi:hypothetical protein